MAHTVTHAQVYYSGRVQGVGFRYSTYQVAQGYVVAGYVRNLSDGRVELEVEGESREVEGFLAAVRRELGHFIRDEDRRTSERESGFQGFAIR